eukprot:3678778-Pleurochrysis_carterae.AAC.1
MPKPIHALSYVELMPHGPRARAAACTLRPTPIPERGPRTSHPTSPPTHHIQPQIPRPTRTQARAVSVAHQSRFLEERLRAAQTAARAQANLRRGSFPLSHTHPLTHLL